MTTDNLLADICRELRAVIRTKILKCPQEKGAVSTSCENGKLTISIPDGSVHLDELLHFLSLIDSDYLSVDEHDCSAGKVKIVCTIGDLDELKWEIDSYYEIYNSELHTFEEIKSFVDSEWDVAGWSVVMTMERNEKTGLDEIVFVLDSENCTATGDEDVVRTLDRLLARKFRFSLRGYTPEFSRTQNAIAYIFRVPHGRFDYVKSVEHVADCEIS